MLRPKFLDISAILVLLLFLTNSLSASSYCDPHCKQNVHISLAYNCEKTITAYDVLYNPSPTCNYYITVYNQYNQPIGNTVNASHVGQTLSVKVVSGGHSCWASIYVTDYHAPVAICDVNTQVSLGSDGSARVYAQTFDDGSYDNCALGPIKVRRMTPGWCPPWVDDDTQFRSYVEFCCEDISSSPIQVVLRVHDLAGNFNECMVNVFVEDKLPPQIHCPTDITLSCDYNFDIWDLSQFGKVATDYYDRDPIYIDDYYYPNHYAGMDGFAVDNCGVWVSEEVHPYLECGQGVINRKFTASDGSYPTSSCVQKIYIRDPHPFNYHDIYWPHDVSIDGCGPQNLDPAVTGTPLFNDDHCSIIATSYRDEMFVVQENACYKVLRHWKVLDWCQYNPHPPYYGHEGIWEHTQVIKLLNSQPPVFASCDDVTFTTAVVQGCTGKVDLPGNATDDCTPDSLLFWEYFIDFDNDGGPIFGMYDIKGTTADASGYYPFGTHKIIWRVEDLCGNLETCQYLFTVRDGKKPTPVCYNGLATVVMPSSGEVALDASYFNVSSYDNCTPASQLRYSYTADVNDTHHSFDCGDVDTTNIVTIYVHDNAGNSNYCTTYVLIQDNNDVCPDQPLVFIESELFTRRGEGVEDANVYLEETDRAMEMEVSNGEGQVAFRSWTRIDSQQFRLRAVKDNDYENGISVSDLILLQRHILGYQVLTDPYDLLAADVNGNAEINIMDLMRLRLLLLGNARDFEGHPSWLFVPENTVFDRPEFPFDFEIMAEEWGSTDHPGKVDFTAVKVGDINLTATGRKRSAPELPQGATLYATDGRVPAGEEFRLSVYAKSATHLNGLRFTLAFDAASVEYLGLSDRAGVLDTRQDNRAYIDRGLVPVIAYRDGSIGEAIQADAVLMEMVFRAKEDVEISSAIGISDELVSRQLTNGQLREESWQLAFEEMEVIAGTPDEGIYLEGNPFRTETSLRIHIPDAKWLKIYIFDQSGRLMQQSGYDHASEFQTKIRKDELGDAGIYYLRVETDERVEVRKLILIE